MCAKHEVYESSADMEGVMEVVLFLTCAQKGGALYLANFIFGYPEYSIDAPGRLAQVRGRSPPLSWHVLTLETMQASWAQVFQGS